MSRYSYVSCHVHFVWSTKKRLPLLHENASIRLHAFISAYCTEKKIDIRKMYINPDHIHILINLPSHLSIEEIVKLIKGSSSYWINREGLTSEKFRWQREYAVFSVSRSVLPNVIRYIENQEEHHKRMSFREEYIFMMKEAGMEHVLERCGFLEEEEEEYGDQDKEIYQDIETVETVCELLNQSPTST